MGFFITFIIFTIIIIFIFSSKTLSPIPYFPSQPVDISKIVKALSLKNNQTVFDLGAGDGIVIFKAVDEAFQKKLNTKFVAVEINPVLILILHLRRFFHTNRKNIKIVYGDIFKMSFSSYGLRTIPYSLTFYFYISPWFLERIIRNLKLEIRDFSVVSYMYPIKSLKKKERIIEGKNMIFVYN